MRKGRVVREGEQPMKWVKQRAVTVGRKRELEVLKEAGSGGLTEGKGEGEEIMQGLYAERQTEEYVPDPVIDVSVYMTLVSGWEHQELTQVIAGAYTEK